MTSPVELAEAIYEAVVLDDPRPFLERCWPDAVIDYPAAGRLPYGGAWAGADGIVAFLEAHDAAEVIDVFEPDEMLPSGDSVVVLGRFEGRAKPSMTPWSTRFVHVLRFREEKLRRWEAYFDTAAAIDAHAAG